MIFHFRQTNELDPQTERMVMNCPLCEKEIKEGEPALPSMMSDGVYCHDECATKKLKEVFEPLAKHLSAKNVLLERLRK